MNKKMNLVADKELFRLWYEFYKLALDSSDKEVIQAIKKSSKFYQPWDVDRTERFDVWWARKRYLFEKTATIQVLSDKDLPSLNSLVIDIPLSMTRAEAFVEIKNILMLHMPVKPSASSTSCRFIPTEVQGVKRESLRMMLDLERHIFRKTSLKGWDLFLRVSKFFESERFRRKANKIPQSFFVDWKIIKGHNHDNAERNLRRYRLKVKKLILNVANGEFPGKY
jgi:hypothetical protein